jgi:hypothetical protein
VEEFVEAGQLEALLDNSSARREAAARELLRWGLILAPHPNGALAPSQPGLDYKFRDWVQDR